MWGNRLGWMISAGILVVTIGLYTMLLIGPSMSDPTDLTTRAGAMDAMTLPGNPQSLVEAGGSGSAADLYKEAISNYRANSELFESYYKTGKLNSPDFKKVIPTIDLLVQAGHISGATIFSKRPEAVVKYNPDQYVAYYPLEQLGHIANRIGLQYNAAKPKPNPELARKYWQAEYALGCAMCSERLTFREFLMGQDLMRSAALNFSVGDAANATAFKGIEPQYRDFVDKQVKFNGIFNPSDPKVINNNAGDVFNLAQHSQERMWRIEAIMMLGHFRYNAANPGDQVAANKVLQKLAGDSSLDLAVATAVKAAQDLTLQQHGNSQNVQ